MSCNVGSADKVVRILVAVALAAVALTTDLGSTLTIVAWVAAGIALLTGLVGFCPLYRVLGVSTCKLEAGAEKS